MELKEAVEYLDMFEHNVDMLKLMILLRLFPDGGEDEVLPLTDVALTDVAILRI